MSLFDFNRDGVVDLAEHFLAYNTFFADESADEQSEYNAKYNEDLDEYEPDDSDW